MDRRYNTSYCSVTDTTIVYERVLTERETGKSYEIKFYRKLQEIVKRINVFS